MVRKIVIQLNSFKDLL